MTKAMGGQSLSVWRSNFASNSFMEKATDVKVSAAGCAFTIHHKVAREAVSVCLTSCNDKRLETAAVYASEPCSLSRIMYAMAGSSPWRLRWTT